MIILFVILLLVILFIPIRVGVGYCDELNVLIKIGPLKKGILPKPKIEHSEKVKKETSSKEPKPKKKLSFYRDMIRTLKRDVYKVLNYMSAHAVKIDDFNFKLKFGWADKAAVGLTYGLTNAFVYMVMGVLHNALTIRKFDIDIDADYEKEIFAVSLDCILMTRLWHIIIMGIMAIKIYFKAKKFMKTGGQKYGTSN